jgi:serine protease Do
MRRLLLPISIALLMAGCGPNARSQEHERAPQRVTAAADSAQWNILQTRRTAITAAVEVVAPAVVSVNVTELEQVQVRDPLAEWFFGLRPRVYQKEVKRVGSGFVISPDGYIVTNDHVAGGAIEILVAFPDGSILEGKLIGTDPVSDIAVVKVEPREPLPYLAFSEAGDVLVGEWVIALGNPFGLFEAAQPSVTVGVVSATGRDYPVEGRSFKGMIQTDAAINPGNSGGPLVNALGEVIGVNTFIYSSTGGSVGIGFAVPAERVARVVDELRDSGQVDRSIYTGLNVLPLSRNPRIARVLRLEKAQGLLVESVDINSPAAAAGIQAYDVILEIAGDTVDDLDDARASLADYRPGDVVPMTIIREGARRQISLRLARQS